MIDQLNLSFVINSPLISKKDTQQIKKKDPLAVERIFLFMQFYRYSRFSFWFPWLEVAFWFGWFAVIVEVSVRLLIVI